MSEAARLYVYGGPELLGWLKRNHLPLDDWRSIGNPWFSEQVGVGNEVTVSEDQWQAALKRRYQAIPEHLRSAVDFDYFARQMEARRSELEADIVASGELQPDDAFDLARHQGVAALRLLETPLNPLGWQLLGQAHQGVCIGLSRGLSLFQRAPNRPRLLRHVRYTPHRTLHGSDTMPFPGWFEDAESMAALNEWRLVLPRHQARETDAGLSLTLPAGAVTELYVGALADVQTVQAARDLQRLYQAYRQAARYRIQVAERSFTLQARHD